MIESLLKELAIDYEIVEHKPVFTVDDLKSLKLNIQGAGCKNLFLSDRKGHYFLYVLLEDKRANLKAIDKMVHSHLSFASERDVKEILNLERGSLTSFGIINDKDKKTIILLDEDIKNKRLLFHPNRNTATMAIEYKDLIKFIEFVGNKYLFINDKDEVKYE